MPTGSLPAETISNCSTSPWSSLNAKHTAVALPYKSCNSSGSNRVPLLFASTTASSDDAPTTQPAAPNNDPQASIGRVYRSINITLDPTRGRP
ncbi:hypothetical protein GQ457_01G031360 [Hibiscus cannabinus]